MGGPRITDAKAIAMLAAYCGGMSKNDISNEFKLSRAAVHYISKRDDWTKKREAFLNSYRRKALKTTEEELNKSIKICDSLLAQLLKEFKADIADEQGSRVIPQERYDMILRILNQKSKLLGLTPTTGGGLSVDMSQSVTLQGMDNQSLEALKRKLLEDIGMGDSVKEADIVKLTDGGAEES